MNDPKQETICLVSGYRVDLRMTIIKRLEELEAERQPLQIQLPNFTNPAEAAVAWAEQYKAKESALIERDEAIKTKAYISSSREASVMGKLSAKSKEVEKKSYGRKKTK